MHTRILPLAAAALVSATLLSSCSFSLSPQVPRVAADEVASVAEDKLEDQVGSRPDISCGSDDIRAEVGRTHTCLLTDPATGLEFDVKITFTEVTGSRYEFDVKVAEIANNAPEATAEPKDGTTPQVTGEQIASLVVQALAPQLGYPPAVSCAEQTVDIIVDTTTSCAYVDDEGATQKVEVTVTSYDASTGRYRISADLV
ncbi:MAG TPA: DUF4333 domain-containing protein [Pseudolysinimonas sp.]|nr:DUF4333 domain-containing protein [Pseudolysinimonas sp.]